MDNEDEMVNGPAAMQAALAPKASTAATRRAELLESKRKREEKAAKEAEAREVEALEVEEKLSAELGERGKAFEIVETVEGPIAVRLGEGVLFKAFSKSKVTEEDIHNFVFPCLAYPKPERYLEIVLQRPEIAARAAHALMNLFGAKHKDDSGKF